MLSMENKVVQYQGYESRIEAKLQQTFKFVLFSKRITLFLVSARCFEIQDILRFICIQKNTINKLRLPQHT